jgi:CHAT domain-containing protein
MHRVHRPGLLLGLLTALGLGAVLFADEPKGKPTPEQRTQLQKQAKDLEEEVLALFQKGRWSEALKLESQALAMRQQLYPRDQYPQGHPELAESLNNLGLLLQYQGEYGQALTYLREALAMGRQLYPKDQYPQGHPFLANALNNLGLLLQHQGEYGPALTYYRQALEMTRQLYSGSQYPQGHPQLATCLNNLGALLQDQGEYGKALTYHEQALEMRRRLYPREQYPQGHPDLATSLNNLGGLLQAQRDYAKALLCHQPALEMLQQLYPKDQYPQGHPYLATSLSNLGSLLQAQGEYAKALTCDQQALAMYQQLYPKDKYPQGHPQLASGLNNLIFHLQEQGEYDRALTYGLQALEMNRRLYPRDKYPQGHPNLVHSHNNLGFLFQARGESARALSCHQEALAMCQGLAEVLADTAAETEALNYLANFPLTRDGFLSASRCADALPPDQVYAPVWRGKAAVARVLAARRQHLHSDDPAVRSLADQLLATRRHLARLLLAPAGGAAHRQRLDDLTAHKEDLERQLVRLDRDLFGLAPRPQPSHQELAEQLPPHTAFIDLLRYTAFEFDPKQPGLKGERRTPRYAAFVLVKGQPVQRLELGDAQVIDEAVAAWRQALLDGKTPSPADAPRRLIWEPLARALPANTETVYLCPDAELAQLPWAALPGGKAGRVLLEDYRLAVVPHGPFLLEQLQRPVPQQPAEPGRLLAIGGVRYSEAAKPRAAMVLRGPAVGDQRLRWPDLPGSGRELDQVLALAGQRPATRLSGTEASIDRVLAELPKAQVAHLATHGFFADARFRSYLRADEAAFGYRGAGPREVPGARNPLVLSGLVLAGANVPADDPLQDDCGILTAEALAGLPLDQLELAVLSACETGLGDVAGGEGVFGLQRAFHLAGARNVVASLWRVNDEATAALMQLFYHHLWREHLPPIEALRQAQLYLYRHPGKVKDAARGAPDFFNDLKTLPKETPGVPAPAGGERGHPRLWAGFVLSGAGQ